MLEVDAIGVPKSRYEVRSEGKGTQGVRVVQKHQHEVLQEHLYILKNTNDVLPYIYIHKCLVLTMVVCHCT